MLMCQSFHEAGARACVQSLHLLKYLFELKLLILRVSALQSDSSLCAKSPEKTKTALTPKRQHLRARIRQYAQCNFTKHTILTSLKRFQCLILRLYWEMVDSHCSSSMKFPAFPASFPLFTSTWSEKPASRHRQATTRTMLLKQFGQGCYLLLLLLL